MCRFSCARDFEHPFSLVDHFLFQLQVGPESHFVPRRLGRARESCREVQQVALGRAIEKNEREVLARVNFMPIFGHKFRGSRTRLPFSLSLINISLMSKNSFDRVFRVAKLGWILILLQNFKQLCDVLMVGLMIENIKFKDETYPVK